MSNRSVVYLAALVLSSHQCSGQLKVKPQDAFTQEQFDALAKLQTLVGQAGTLDVSLKELRKDLKADIDRVEQKVDGLTAQVAVLNWIGGAVKFLVGGGGIGGGIVLVSKLFALWKKQPERPTP